jgi:hypothetical protein
VARKGFIFSEKFFQFTDLLRVHKIANFETDRRQVVTSHRSFTLTSMRTRDAGPFDNSYAQPQLVLKIQQPVSRAMALYYTEITHEESKTFLRLMKPSLSFRRGFTKRERTLANYGKNPQTQNIRTFPKNIPCSRNASRLSCLEKGKPFRQI